MTPETQTPIAPSSSLQQFAHLCVEEPENARCTDILHHLQPAELALYRQLQQTHQRLEQERLPMKHVQQSLSVLQ